MIHCYGMIIEDLEIRCCLLKKTSGTSKVNRQAQQLKKDDGTLTTDDTEKATMLNDYFRTVAEKLIGPADEI